MGKFLGADAPHKVLNDFCEWKICIYSCFASAGLEWVSRCEAPWNRIPRLRTGFETNFKCTSTGKGFAFLLRYKKATGTGVRGTARCHRLCQGGAACGAHSLLPGAGTGKPEPPPASPHRAPALPGAGAPARPRHPPKLREKADTGRAVGYQRAPAAPAAVCGCKRTHGGPQTLGPRRPLEPPTPERTKEPKRNSPGRVPGAPAAPAQNVRLRRCSSAGCEPTAHPQLRHPRDTHRCGASGLAGPRGPVLLGPCTRPVRPQLLSAPVAGGSWEDSPDRGLCLSAAEALPARRSGGRELRPAVHRRGGPPPASGCGGPVALAAAAAKANAAAAAGAAPTTTARPGARRGLMLSSAVSPPLWVPGAAENLHIRAPSPSRSRPAARGLRPRPLPSRDGARGRPPGGLPCGAGGATPEQLAAPGSAGVLSLPTPPHRPGRPRAASPPPPAPRLCRAEAGPAGPVVQGPAGSELPAR